MPTAKLTKSVIDRLKPGSPIVWDQTVIGFGARCQLKSVFYILRYRLNGTQRMITIGRHGSPWTPDTARNKAKEMLGLVAQKIDPRAPPSTDTFGANVNRYLEWKRGVIKPGSFIQTQRHLREHSKPLHHIPLGDLDRRTIAQRLGEIETNSGSVTRNRVRASLSGMFSWAIREGLTEINPVTGTGKAKENSRERTLSPEELGQVLKSLGKDAFGDIARMLVLTAQRREEIGGLEWTEVDLIRQMIVLPPERTKNNRLHELPLSKQAFDIINRRPQEETYVWGSRWTSWSNNKRALDLKLKFKEPFTLHDLRRSAATLMAEQLNILPHIIEAILNHVSGHKSGIAGIYNRARYEIGMRDALQLWADYVTKLETTD
jgi:integrase